MIRTKPILFSGPMVRALLDGRKTQTRRVLKPQPPKDELGFEVIGTVRGPEWYHPAVVGEDGELEPGKQVWGVYDDSGGWGARVPYMPGDLLWVKETFQQTQYGKAVYRADARDQTGRRWSEIMPGDPDGEVLWRPSIFMPRILSRLTLEVTSVKVERLQEISADDALAEGVTKIRDHCYVIRGFGYDLSGLCHSSPIVPFANLWDSLSGKRKGCSWEDNPWVIALTFVVHQQNVDQLLAARKAA